VRAAGGAPIEIPTDTSVFSDEARACVVFAPSVEREVVEAAATGRVTVFDVGRSHKELRALIRSPFS